ncbi:hypothetical protein H0H87_002954, partial [Tephrocybe sp. NHM501043]
CMKGTSKSTSKTLTCGPDGQFVPKIPLTTPSLPVMSSTPPSPEPVNIISLAATVADIATTVQGLAAQHIGSASSTANAPNATLDASISSNPLPVASASEAAHELAPKPITTNTHVPMMLLYNIVAYTLVFLLLTVIGYQHHQLHASHSLHMLDKGVLLA